MVLDSLARFHSMDEQSAGDMAKLFKLALTPLARETGAAVLVLHHKVKPQGNRGGLVTSRGSGDLTAVIDQGIDVKLDEYGTVTLEHYKSRRSTPHGRIRATIADEDNRVVVSAL
jgi:RecA-family ATPase